MSTMTAPARPSRRAAALRQVERVRAPRLRVVTQPPAQRGRLPFVLCCITLLMASLIGLLVLNISLSRGAYRVHDLEVKAARLAEQEQALGEEVATRAAPAQLSIEARGLGMVPSTSPAFLRLSDGVILGSPQPAQAAPPPPLVVGIPAPTGPATARTEGEVARQSPVAIEAAALHAPAAEPQPEPPTGDGAVPVP
jgi:hypothetical protein